VRVGEAKRVLVAVGVAVGVDVTSGNSGKSVGEVVIVDVL
jgi:hypothetical protein